MLSSSQVLGYERIAEIESLISIIFSWTLQGVKQIHNLWKARIYKMSTYLRTRIPLHYIYYTYLFGSWLAFNWKYDNCQDANANVCWWSTGDIRFISLTLLSPMILSHENTVGGWNRLAKVICLIQHAECTGPLFRIHSRTVISKMIQTHFILTTLQKTKQFMVKPAPKYFTGPYGIINPFTIKYIVLSLPYLWLWKIKVNDTKKEKKGAW